MQTRHSSPASRRTGRRTRGQSLVEFAVVLPVFLLILSGIMDFGFLLYSRMTVINAAREGARVATTVKVPEDAASIPSLVSSRVSDAASPLSVSTTTTCIPSCDPGNSVRVTVNYGHQAFFPLLFGTTIPITSTVQMVLE